jgi:hypothetical protein
VNGWMAGNRRFDTQAMKKITDKDRFVILYLDKTLAIATFVFFLYFHSLQEDFLALLCGIACCICWFFTVRYTFNFFRSAKATQAVAIPAVMQKTGSV